MGQSLGSGCRPLWLDSNLQGHETLIKNHPEDARQAMEIDHDKCMLLNTRNLHAPCCFLRQQCRHISGQEQGQRGADLAGEGRGRVHAQSSGPELRPGCHWVIAANGIPALGWPGERLREADPGRSGVCKQELPSGLVRAGSPQLSPCPSRLTPDLFPSKPWKPFLKAERAEHWARV